MKFTNEYRGVPEGQIYPVQYQPGDECPPELEESATAQGALESPEPTLVKPTRAKK